METGTGNKRRIIDITATAEGLDSDVVKALPGFHAFTGCDSTSSFVRKGKKGPLKILLKNTHFVDAFKQLGDQVLTFGTTTVHGVSSLEAFVCHMYGKPKYENVDSVRCDIFRSRYEPRTTNQALSMQNGIDLSLLPPCRSALHMHILRSNYQAYIWKHSHKAMVEAPSPVGHGWKRMPSDGLDIEWTEKGKIMPSKLLDILAQDDRYAVDDDDKTTNETCEDESLEAQFKMTEEDELDNIIDEIFDDDDDDDDDVDEYCD